MNKEKKTDSLSSKYSKVYFELLSQFYFVVLFLTAINTADNNKYFSAANIVFFGVGVLLFTYISLGLTVFIFSSEPKLIEEKSKSMQLGLIKGLMLAIFLFPVLYLIGFLTGTLPKVSYLLSPWFMAFIIFSILYLYIIVEISKTATYFYLKEKNKDYWINYESPFAYFVEVSFRASVIYRFLITFSLVVIFFQGLDFTGLFGATENSQSNDWILFIFAAIVSGFFSIFFDRFYARDSKIKYVLIFFAILLLTYVLANEALPFFAGWIVEELLLTKIILVLGILVALVFVYVYYKHQKGISKNRKN